MIYVDTGLLVSLYSLEAHSAIAVAVLKGVQESSIVTSLGELKAVNAFALRVFRQEISPIQAESSQRESWKDLRAEVFQRRTMP